ncbi:Small EDRK-rich factor 2 [Tupaia chinensis]|uniref:Small EDRK-rich factor 2 n=1 Tax=Tupaia chinensis TaxID=246437 RepID=L9L2A3_TUPCH|nr:Small EDRK-rich factor 2 [Tupaia chinensis]
MTPSNQRELICQKDMKKQVTQLRKDLDDRLSTVADRQRDPDIIQQKQKQANVKEKPKQHCGFLYNPLALSLCPWSQSNTCVSSCGVHRSLCPESAEGLFFTSFFSGSLSPHGSLLRLRELPLLSVCYSHVTHPQSIRRCFVIYKRGVQKVVWCLRHRIPTWPAMVLIPDLQLAFLLSHFLSLSLVSAYALQQIKIIIIIIINKIR